MGGYEKLQFEFYPDLVAYSHPSEAIIELRLSVTTRNPQERLINSDVGEFYENSNTSKFCNLIGRK